MNDINYIFKVAVIGDGRVGKTTLIKRFTQGSFEKEYIKTIGAQLFSYIEEMDGVKIKLLFWDIAGQDSFHFLRPSFFNTSKAAIIVFSLEENRLGKESFNNISTWYEEIVKYCGNIPIVLFANKVDLVDENTLNYPEIQGIADENEFLGYFITSAKTGKGVNKAFSAISENLFHTFKSLPAEL
ncbi:MAG: Rab family GTPase [Promethearchaeota archaeon]|jgi:small GTP-binding protein